MYFYFFHRKNSYFKKNTELEVLQRKANQEIFLRELKLRCKLNYFIKENASDSFFSSESPENFYNQFNPYYIYNKYKEISFMTEMWNN